MKLFIVSEDKNNEVFHMVDPDIFNEAEFEHTVVKILSKMYPDYFCILYGGTFLFDGNRYRPDIALIAHDLSHWFVIEVEIKNHSLQKHVLPQVRCFVYGEPQVDGLSSLVSGISIDRSKAETFLKFVPRSVAVISNVFLNEWNDALAGIDSQFLVVTSYKSNINNTAIEINGTLQVIQKSIGWGKFSATDRSIKFPHNIELPDGGIQLIDSNQKISSWIVRKSTGNVWVTKDYGNLDVPDGSYIQIVKTYTGAFLIRYTN